MRLTNLFFLSSLTLTRCWAGIIIGTPKYSEVSSLVDATVNLVKSCYADRVNAIGLVGKSPKILIVKLSSMSSLSVTLVDNTTDLKRNWPVSRKSRYSLQVFAVTAHSSTELESSLREVKGSLWWNHMASFIILEMPLVSNNGCSNAFEILKTAWEMDILNAKLICHHPTKGILMYNYNPYTGYAPDNWQFENTYRGKNDHPWTLFVQGYREDKRICDELDFDKTKDLGGYEIRSTVKNALNSWRTIPNKTGIDSFGGYSGVTAQMLFRALNATPKILHHKDSNGFLIDPENPIDIAEEMASGMSDIGLNARFQLTVINATTTYPYRHAGMSTITQDSGYASQLSAIWPVANEISEYGMYLVILMTLIFFKYLRRLPSMTAILNTIRIICSTPLTKLPTNQAARIYLASIFLFAITIQVIYQGKLTSMLTERVHLPNIDTKEDLAESRHKIYGYKLYAIYFKEPEFEGRFFPLEDFKCSDDVLRDPLVACIKAKRYAFAKAVELNLHCSRRTIVKTRDVLVIRPDWPLEERVNKILTSMKETDLIWLISFKKHRRAMDTFRQRKVPTRSDQFKVISLADLTFAFVILGFGLGCATVSFIVEIAIG